MEFLPKLSQSKQFLTLIVRTLFWKSMRFCPREHNIRLGELQGSLSLVWGSLSLVWGSLSLVWVDIFLTFFSLSKNSSKTHFCPEIKETQFCPQFASSFLIGTHFTDNSNENDTFQRE